MRGKNEIKFKITAKKRKLLENHIKSLEEILSLAPHLNVIIKVFSQILGHNNSNI